MVRRSLFALVLALAVGVAAPASAYADDAVDLYFFWGDGCPHCAAEKEFLDELTEEFPVVTIHEYEVWHHEDNRRIMAETLAELGMEPDSVPTTIVEGQVWVGFTDRVGEQIRAAVAESLGEDAGPVAADEVIHIPLLGDVDVATQSLAVATLAIGFVDGFNPCSLWVMSILLALVLRTGSRRRVLAVGLVFLGVTALLYAFYIGGLYGVLGYVAYSGWIRSIMALVAMAMGLVTLWDYLSRNPKFTLSISDEHKPGIYRRIRAIADPERSLPGVLGATVVLAVGVSLLETPCTAGYPVLWAGLLTEQGVALATAAGLFALYMAVFLLDELAVFGVAVVAMRATKLEDRHGRALKLVSGSVMVMLALVLVFFPRLMESVTGALGVFGASAGLAALIYAIDRLRRPGAPAGHGGAVA